MLKPTILAQKSTFKNWTPRSSLLLLKVAEEQQVVGCPEGIECQISISGVQTPMLVGQTFQRERGGRLPLVPKQRG